MEVINGDITKIEEGVIVHQTNCSGAFGAGVSGAIAKKWPVVEKEYWLAYNMLDDDEIMGFAHIIYPNEKVEMITNIDEATGEAQTYQSPKEKDIDLIVINLFTQRKYGNAYKTGECYTDVPLLIRRLHDICALYSDRKVYIPHRIGCGLAGGNWDEVYDGIKNIPNLVAVRLT